MSSTFRLLLHVGISVYYYTQQNRACPLVIACDASIIFTAIYHTLNGFELVLQASRNKSQHSQHGNTTTLCLEQLIPDLRNIPEAKIGPLEKHTLLSLRTTEAHLSTPLISLQTRPQAPHKAKARTGRRQTHLTSDGTKWYTKPRLLLRKQGLRPDAKAQFSPATPEGRAEHLPIIKKGIKTNSKREQNELAPPPRGAPGVSTNEECQPVSPPLRTFLGHGSSARRERRREYRRWRRARKVLIRLGRLGKDTGKEGTPLNAAAKRSAGTHTAKKFKELLQQAEWKGPKREKGRQNKATPQKPYGTTLKIATQNVQGIAEILKHQQTIALMTQYGLDILVLTETRSKSYYSYNSQGYQFIVNGSPKEAYAGVTVIIAPHIRPYVQDVIQHSPRLTQITIACQEGNTHIIGAYAPHNKIESSQKHAFWDMLEDIFSATPLPEPTYIIGDLNVRLQGRSTQEKLELGPHVYGRGRQHAQRKPDDNRTLYMNLLTGHSAVDAMTFKTPNLLHHITYRDKAPPPKDWSGFITDPLGWLHLYDKIQTLPADEQTQLRVASTIREFVTADQLLASTPIPPTVDPLRFQSLDKLVTKRKWLPTVLKVRAHHNSGFPSDHYILVAECRVKLGAKIPKTSRPPTRSYSANAEFPKAFRKHYARNSLPEPLATPPDIRAEVFTDGSGSQGRCGKYTPAGWGFVILAEEEVLEESSGPVITEDTHPFTFGAKVGSNNTGELQAWMEACAYLIRPNPPADVTFFYDSKWMAQMVRGQARPKRYKEMVHSARLLRQQLEQTTRLQWQWVKGHKGVKYNERADKLAEEGKTSTSSTGGRFAQTNPLLLSDLTQHTQLTQGTVEEKYNRFLTAARAAEQESFPPKQATPQKPWITQELADKISQAKRMNANLDQGYSSYYKSLKKEARSLKKQWLRHTFENNPNPNQKTLWANLRKLKKGFSERKRRLVVNGRQIPWSKTHEAFAHHLTHSQWAKTQVTPEERELLKESPPLRQQDTKPQKPFTHTELTATLNKLKKGKAPGPDGLRQDLLLLMDTFGEAQILDLMNTCWTTKTIPQDWKDAIACSFYKGKGDDADATNYRPIALLNTLYKIYASLIQARLSENYDQLLRSTQYGFRRGRSTQHPLFILRRLQDYSARTGQQFHLVFLDWRMAFDKVDHESMIIALQRFGLHQHYIDIIKDIYTNPSFYTIGVNGEKAKGTPHTGIRQGCPLSPYLFIIVMTVLLADVDRRLLSTGVPTNTWSVGKPVYDIEYADDTLLFGVTITAVEYLRNVQSEATLYGLFLNFTKTEYLKTQHNNTPPSFIDSTPTPTNEKIKYLGSMVSWNNPTLEAINHRISQAHIAYGKLSQFWKTSVPKTTRLTIFRSYVVSVLLYGLSTLTLEDKHLKKIDSWYYQFLRRVVGIKAAFYSRIPNQAVWEKANRPIIPSQTLLSEQFQQLTTSLFTPHHDPIHHVVFSPGYKDRVGIQKNHKRGPPPPHWLGLVSARALEFFQQDVKTQPGYSSQLRVDFLGLKQYLQKHPSYSARLAAAPTRFAHLFSMYHKSIGSAWRS